MRRIKEEVLERLTKWSLSSQTLSSGVEVMQDFVSAANFGFVWPGAHERDEAKEILFNNSLMYHETLHLKHKKEDLVEKIDNLIAYLEFNHYFYGVTGTPASLMFYEDDNGRLGVTPLATMGIALNEFKPILQKHTPKFVLLHAVYPQNKIWNVRCAFKKDVKSIFDNPKYIEIYNPKEDL